MFKLAASVTQTLLVLHFSCRLCNTKRLTEIKQKHEKPYRVTSTTQTHLNKHNDTPKCTNTHLDTNQQHKKNSSRAGMEEILKNDDY